MDFRKQAKRVIQIQSRDNVAVALENLERHKKVLLDGQYVILQEKVLQGHKFAIKEIRAGEEIVKYGYPIGVAKVNISSGQWIHTHNMRTKLDENKSYEYCPAFEAKTVGKQEFFQGYLRTDGSVGTRNEIWIVPTVGCVNSIANKIRDLTEHCAEGRVDGIRVFSHPYGCSQMGEDHKNLQKALAALVRHPNAGAALVLGLGCENNNIGEFQKVLGDYDTRRVFFLECQAVQDEIQQGAELVKKLISYAAGFKRSLVPISKLVVGLKCGGSDGLSGLTANPLVGRFSDHLVACGGTSILTEVPEMFGAETILMNRCQDQQTFQNTVELIQNFKKYYTDHGQVVYENPSPGNKMGGITTLEDKSLGCIQKGGGSKVADVLQYTERVKQNGLNLLQGPGNDIVSTSALVMSGAQLILFTTGRGNPMGAGVPTIKIASNSGLSQFKENWIDFNAGSCLEQVQVRDLDTEFFQYVVQVAEGRKTKSEKAGFFEFTLWKQGVTL